MTALMWTLSGDPQRKERPRVARGRAFTPKTTRVAEARIAEAFREEFPSWDPLTDDLVVVCEFHRRTRHWVDVDNLLKLVTDALNGIAYVDDKQISDLRGIRFFGAGDNARTVLRIETREKREQ